MTKFFKKLTDIKILILVLCFYIFSSAVSVSAQCGPNTVPDLLDPECNGAPLTFGMIADRILSYVPYVIAGGGAAAFGVIGIKMLIAVMGKDGSEKAAEYWPDVITVIKAIAFFYSIWMIFFVIENVLGANLLS